MADGMKPVRCGCGGEAVVKMWAEPDTPFLVMCEKCKASSGDYSSEAEAIEAWNRAMGAKEQVSMVWKPAKHRPAYEKGICSCGYVLSVLQRDFIYCPMCGARLEWE